ncbi:H-NS family nucleoid-associated regulatory protein [Loktanella salsilacus]|uniref:H-NS histone family protein n=1 Tax=Loktanella salsilacus TaxID=195913 RepID=UPI003703D52A
MSGRCPHSNSNKICDRTVKKTTAVSPPKYCHPENPEQTWTGRGRQPDWMKDALENGQSKEEFLIA